MQAIPLVRASSIRPMLEYAERSGAPLTPRLAAAMPTLDRVGMLIPVVYAGILLHDAVTSCGIEALGLRAAETAHVVDLSDWGAVLTRASTVGGLIDLVVRTSNRFNSGQRFWAVQRGDEIWLHRHMTASLQLGRQPGSDFATMMIIDAIRLGAGPRWRPTEIHFDCAPPAHAEELRELAEKRAFFEQPNTALVFPAELMALRLPRIVPSHGLTVAPVPGTTFERSVRQMVDALIRLGAPGLGLAAEAVGMSERSLQRRLTECGLSFTRLVEDARFESAVRMLRDPDVKIVEVSAELGYSDSANFTRAFRRWAGIAPDAFRRSV